MLIGETLDGRYLLEEEIGAGGMGTVYRARDLSRDAAVAIKILHPSRAADAARATREAETLAALPLPGIVRYLGHGTLGGSRYLVTEWIPGGTLSDRLVSQGLSAAEAVQVVRSIAEVLAPVHEAGVVHRDIKPTNVLLAGNRLDDVRVIDFGLAWRAELTRLTRTGTMVGTPGYMAPEQIRGERRLDARLDVFALGCLLYECLTGRPAFIGDGITAVQAKILLAQPPPVGDLVNDLPVSLAVLVGKLLHKDPRGRPRDAREVATALAALPALPASPRRQREAAFWPDEKRRLEEAMGGLTTAAAELFWVVLALSDEEEPADLASCAAAHRATVERLGDGSIVAAPEAQGTVAEQAAQAARLALALRAIVGEAPIVVVSGAGHRDAPRVLDGLIERGLRLLENAALAALAGSADVRVDERTAGLLGPEFQVQRSGSGAFILPSPADPSGGSRAG